MPKWPDQNNKKRDKSDNSFNYFTLCGIDSNNIIEIGVDGLVDIEQKYGVEGYQDLLGKYDKVIVSEQTEGYGMAIKLENFYHNFDKEKIFIINDGFVCEKYLRSHLCRCKTYICVRHGLRAHHVHTLREGIGTHRAEVRQIDGRTIVQWLIDTPAELAEYLFVLFGEPSLLDNRRYRVS